MKTIKINIYKALDEKTFIESMLNYKYSKIIDDKTILLFLGFYALKKSWHFSKLNHYLKLLELNT